MLSPSLHRAECTGRRSWQTCALGRNEMDPPLCGSTAMSPNVFQSRELMEPQEASPMKHEMSVLGIAMAQRVFHALGVCPRISTSGMLVSLRHAVRASRWPRPRNAALGKQEAVPEGV